VRFLEKAPIHEVRIDEERSVYARLSASTLRYMWEAGEALGAWLRWHGGNLVVAAAEEPDLYEAIRLSARLMDGRASTARVERGVEGLRAELLRRELREDARAREHAFLALQDGGGRGRKAADDA